MPSYVVYYRSTDPSKLLVGGVKASVSSRWGLKSDAENYLEVVKGNNGPHCEGEVVSSPHPPEIFPHCPDSPAQAIGGRCFKCGLKITRLDAIDYKEPTDAANPTGGQEAAGLGPEVS